jgi:hypothetical protein
VRAPLSRDDSLFIAEQKEIKARTEADQARIRAEKDAAIKRDVDVGEQARQAQEQEEENKRKMAEYKKNLRKIKSKLKPL